MNEPEQVGTIEMLTMRVYPLDPNAKADVHRTTVVVQPGIFPVYRKFDTYYWMMSGRINGRGFEKLGDGLFSMNEGDSEAGPEVTFPSPTFGVEQFRDFLAESLCTEGDPAQRLRFTLTESVAADQS